MGQGWIPKIMGAAAQHMPTIIGSFAQGGGLSSILSGITSMFGNNRA